MLAAALRRIPATDLEAWVAREPTGAFARRAWFLSETLNGEALDLPDAIVGNYTPALDPQRHVVAPRRNSKRHRVADTLLGDARFCPTVRRTPTLIDAMAWDLGALALARDVGPTDVRELATLQGQIVDERFAAKGWRTEQSYVGHTAAGYREVVDYTCPRPEDVADLMDGWAAAYERLLAPEVDTVMGTDRDLTVLNDTAHLYTTFDATHPVEYTYDRLRDAIDVDLAEELGFLDLFDRALQGVQRIIDLPDRRARELVQFVLQNDGRLATRKRGRFTKLTDEEVAASEDAINAASDAIRRDE